MRIGSDACEGNAGECVLLGVGIGIAFDCRDFDRGGSSGFNLSPARGVSWSAESGDAGLELGRRPSRNSGNVWLLSK
jgi:hypothetical protein